MNNPTSSASPGHIKTEGKKSTGVFEKIKQVFKLFNSQHKGLRNSILGLIAFCLATEVSFYISVYFYGIVECMAKPVLARVIGFEVLALFVLSVAIIGFVGYHLVKMITKFAQDVRAVLTESNN